MNSPPFISNPDYCRRLFLPSKKRIDKKVKSISRVKAERKGGFLNRSFRIRYEVLVEKTNGRKIKVAFWGLSSPDPTRFQSWQVMNYLWKKNFSSGIYRIAQPLAFIKKHSMVITKEIKGESFLKILEKKSLGEISSALKKSANWLKKLHKTPLYHFRDIFSPSYRRAYWQEQLRILKKGFPRKIKFFKKNIKEILNWEDQNRESKNLVITHHDFHPKNIFFKGREIWILDFSESRLSRPIVDIFTFLCQLDLINSQEIKRFSPNNLKNFSKIFLKEYFGQNWRKILQNPTFKKDFIILKKRVALQALVGSLLFGEKPKIFSDIIFDKI